MTERETAAYISALQETLTAVEGDLSKASIALSRSVAAESFAKVCEPASIRLRVADLEQELALLPS
jgi:hypothetical protein